MSDSLALLRRRIRNTEDLRSVVKTMKAMAASSIAQFEWAAEALADYQQTVERALSLCVREIPAAKNATPISPVTRGIIVLGTDQGMAGQFNEHIVEAVTIGLQDSNRLWVVGERAQERLENAGQNIARVFPTPQSVEAITPLVGEVLLEVEAAVTSSEVTTVDLCHNVPVKQSGYETRWTSLLPLDEAWRERLRRLPWPTKCSPEMLDGGETTWRALVSEFLFVTLYRACAESSTAENAARLAAMQRAEKNIDDRRRELDLRLNSQRQSTIDAELFDLIAGFEALS